MTEQPPDPARPSNLGKDPWAPPAGGSVAPGSPPGGYLAPPPFAPPLGPAAAPGYSPQFDPNDPYRYGRPDASSAYPPPPYQYYPAPPSGPGNGMAIAGLVLGIAAVALFWIPFFGYLPAILGIIFAALGLKAANRGQPGKGLAIAGLTCAIIAAVGTTGISAYVLTHVGSCASRYAPGTSDYDDCISGS